MGKSKRQKVTLYDLNTGAIHSISSLRPEQLEALEGKGFGWVPGHIHGGNLRLNLKTMQPEPLSPPDLVVSDNRIEGIPEGSFAIIQGRKVRLDAGVLVIGASHDQEVGVIVHSPGALHVDLKVNCLAGEQTVKAGEMLVELVQDYRKVRRAQYPSLADQLDAIWKGGDEEVAMRQRVMRVKAKVPKEK